MALLLGQGWDCETHLSFFIRETERQADRNAGILVLRTLFWAERGVGNRQTGRQSDLYEVDRRITYCVCVSLLAGVFAIFLSVWFTGSKVECYSSPLSSIILFPPSLEEPEKQPGLLVRINFLVGWQSENLNFR